MQVHERRPREREMSTNISLADARRERFLLPSRACQTPPGIGETATLVSTEVQTVSDDASHAVHSVSEEGSSHLADDGWAETQERVKSICTQLVDLSVAVDAIPNCVSSDVADVSHSRVVSELAPSSSAHDFVDLLDMYTVEVAHDQSLKVFDCTSLTDMSWQKSGGPEVDTSLDILVDGTADRFVGVVDSFHMIMKVQWTRIF